MLFGTVLARVNMSACRVPLPNRTTSSMNRRNPAPGRRRCRRPSGRPRRSVGNGPVGRAALLELDLALGPRSASGSAADPTAGHRRLRHRGGPWRARRRRSGRPAARPAAARPRSCAARSLATWRIRRAVVPTSTMPAAMAISQPVVPAWVAVISTTLARPTGVPSVVCSRARTFTLPLVSGLHLGVGGDRHAGITGGSPAAPRSVAGWPSSRTRAAP